MEQLSFTFETPSALLAPDEIFQLVDASELLRRLDEDNRLERKPPGFHPRSLGEYVCMWANTAPSGGLIGTAGSPRRASTGFYPTKNASSCVTGLARRSNQPRGHPRPATSTRESQTTTFHSETPDDTKRPYGSRFRERWGPGPALSRSANRLPYSPITRRLTYPFTPALS